MRGKLFGVATGLILFGASPATAITYNISDNAGIPSDPGGGLFLTGSITTDGKIGALLPVDITAWSLTVSGDSRLVTLTESNSYFTLIGSALTATATALSFNYNAPIGYRFQFFLDGNPNPGITWMADGNSPCCGRFALSNSPLGDMSGEVEMRGGVVSYPAPAPVPLPPSIIAQLTGLGLLGLLAWRRKRKNVGALAAA